MCGRGVRSKYNCVSHRQLRLLCSVVLLMLMFMQAGCESKSVYKSGVSLSQFIRVM